MNFSEVLRRGSFSLHLESDTKEGIIAEMIDLMVKDGLVADREEALSAVLEREQRLSTGMQYGVALPHGKTASADRLVTAFALKKEGIDFDSIDGQPCRIFVMTVSSVNQTGPHVQYLAEMSRLLTKPSVRQGLLACETVDEVVAILCPGGAKA